MATYKPDPVLTGSHLAGQKYQAQIGMPNKHDVNAELFKDVRSALGDKPRGWGAVGAGLARGLEYGSRMSSLEERKEDLTKYNKVMNYFEEINQNSLERKEKEEREAAAKQAILPQVLSYIQNYSKYDPISRQNVFQNALEAYNKANGTNYKLDSIDGANPLKATLSDGEETVFFDIANAFQSNEALQAEVARQMPSYQLEMQRQREQQDLENRRAQDDLDIKRYNAQTNRMGVENRERASVNSASQSLTPEEMEKNTYMRLYELLKEGDPTVSSVPGTNLSRRIASSIPIVGGLFREGLGPQQEYKELVADLKGQKFKKHGYRNQAEFENIHTLEPDLPHDEALKLVETKLKQLGVNPNESPIENNKTSPQFKKVIVNGEVGIVPIENINDR